LIGRIDFGRQTFIQKAMNKQADKRFEQAHQAHQHLRKLSTRMKFGLAWESSIYVMYVRPVSIDETKKMSHSREEW